MNGPKKNANSQVEDTHIYIWSVGNTKTITFSKHCCKLEKRRQITMKIIIRLFLLLAEYHEKECKGHDELCFNLEHLSLFDLDPRVEKWTKIELNRIELRLL